MNASCTIFDELWGFRNYDLWEALTHSPARKEPLHFIISYASYQPWEGALLWDLYQRGIKNEDPRQFTFWVSGEEANPASWITEEYLEQQKRRLPEHIFNRLHLNQFTSGAGTFITRKEIDRALNPTLKNKPFGRGERYFIAIDLGLTNDRTVVTVLHKNQNGKAVLDHIKTFSGNKERSVQISEVEKHVLELYHNFRTVKAVIFDIWQLQSTRQRFVQAGLPCKEFVFHGANLTRLTENLLSHFRDGRIEIFDHEELVKELLSVVIRETNYGFRIDHEAGAHDDHVISLGMALFESANEPLRRPVTQADFKQRVGF